MIRHGLLLNAQVIDLESTLRVGLVEVLEVVVERVSLRTELEDLLLLRRDRTVQVFDLVVQHEFELLQLLGLLLKAVDLLLPGADELVALADLGVEVVRLLLQVGVDFVLAVDEHALF